MEDVQTLNKIILAKPTTNHDESIGYDEAAVFYILSKLLFSNQSREPLGFPAFSKYKSLVCMSNFGCLVKLDDDL